MVEGACDTFGRFDRVDITPGEVERYTIDADEVAMIFSSMRDRAGSHRLPGVLVVLSGRPGVGKTTVGRELARATGGVYVRIDSIEQAMRAAGWHVESEGYRVAYAVAEDNLRLGGIVVADCVNPWPITRNEWREVAARAGVRAVDVEIVCSDEGEHRRRVEARRADIPGHRLPTWPEVVGRDYRPWTDDRLEIDTARLDVQESVRTILNAVSAAVARASRRA